MRLMKEKTTIASRETTTSHFEGAEKEEEEEERKERKRNITSVRIRKERNV